MNIKQLQKQAHQNAKAKGFWKNNKNIAEKLMLIVSELSEAMEADRENRYITKDHIRHYKAGIKLVGMKDSFEMCIKNRFEDELADVAIRLGDLAEAKGVDLTWHIQEKMKYNKTRKKKHGKKY